MLVHIYFKFNFKTTLKEKISNQKQTNNYTSKIEIFYNHYIAFYYIILYLFIQVLYIHYLSFSCKINAFFK